jgi:Mn2+/Fe2+ NRAMP family transporter
VNPRWLVILASVVTLLIISLNLAMLYNFATGF